MSEVYQCKSCRRYYGHHTELPDLTPMPTDIVRYLDSSAWRCPYCGACQDSRDIEPFLGVGGTGQTRLLSEAEIGHELLVNRRHGQHMFDT